MAIGKPVGLSELRGLMRRFQDRSAGLLISVLPWLVLPDTARANVSLLPVARGPDMADVRPVSLNAQRLDVSLADAVYLGLRGNRDIQSAYFKRVTDTFDLRVAEDAFTPRLVISSKHLAHRNQSDRHRDHSLTPSARMNSAWGTRFSLAWTQRINRADAAGRERHHGVSLEVVQPLLKGAGRQVNTAPLRKARLNENSQRLALRAQVSQTVSSIISAYRELLKAQEQVRIARDAMRRSRQLLDVNDALIEAGRMARLEKVQAEADLAYQELGVEEAANHLDESRAKLLRLLALDLDTPIKASDAVVAKSITIDRQQAIQLALHRQPDYLRQLIEAEQADIDLLLAQDQRRWDVSLVTGMGQDHDARSYSDVQTHRRSWGGYAGVQLEVPIGDLGQRQRLLSAQVAVKEQVLRQAEARQALEQDVASAVRDMSTQWRQSEIALRVRDMSQTKLQLEREKLQSGRSSNFQVLRFESDLRLAENAVLNTQIAYLNAQTRLDERLGMTLDSWDIVLND